MKLQIMASAALLAFLMKTPQTANLINKMPAPEAELVDLAVLEMEAYSRSKFMHAGMSADFIITIEEGPLPENVLGLAMSSPLSCRIVLSPELRLSQDFDYSDIDYMTVVSHEIGHCFGLGHDPDLTQVMGASYHPAQNSGKSYTNFIKALNKARGVD